MSRLGENISTSWKFLTYHFMDVLKSFHRTFKKRLWFLFQINCTLVKSARTVANIQKQFRNYKKIGEIFFAKNRQHPTGKRWLRITSRRYHQKQWWYYCMRQWPRAIKIRVSWYLKLNMLTIKSPKFEIAYMKFFIHLRATPRILVFSANLFFFFVWMHIKRVPFQRVNFLPGME